jgi:N-acetylmuramoyl-L-alanine amidase
MADLKYLQSVNVTQSDENTVRVSVVSRGAAHYQIQTEGDTTSITFTISTLKNISYGGDNTLRLQKDSAYPIDINHITVEDHYNAKQYIVTLPGSFTDWLGSGDLPINDGYLKSVSVKKSENRSQIIFFEKRVLAFTITEDSQTIYITAVLPREQHAKIVILDPGHGSSDPGARANGLIEKDVVLDISTRLLRLIEQEGKIKAYATRRTDVIMDLYDRPVWANETGDLFVSIHMNATGNGNVDANGTEVYYYPHDNDGALGFSGENLANILHKNLLTALGSADRGVKSARFVVIRNTKIPAALIEVGFLTNPAEASKLATDAYRQTAAEAIYRSILEAFEQYSPPR